MSQAPDTDDLLLRCLEAQEAGDPDAIQRILDEHPERAQAVRKRLEALRDVGLAPAIVLPMSIGVYTLTSRISRGGMGEVYLAQQKKPLERTIAIKTLRAERHSKRFLELFQREQQILANLKHPGIVPIFDAGIAPNGGFPYFAMEYVEGQHLTGYCDQNSLSIEDRVRLLTKVCEPIHYAHMNGVLHRDLKPSNILIASPAGSPVVKIIDFGLGKLRDVDHQPPSPPEQGAGDQGPDLVASSQTSPGMGTPFYMSPEQKALDGGAIDLRTDVYTLGIILYQLLTGTIPEHTSTHSPGNIASGDTPSSVAPEVLDRTAQKLGLKSGTQLRKRLKGDLDAIVARSSSFDREQRYQSVAALSADLWAFLEKRPIQARPIGPARTALKWVRRHRLASAMAALALLTLLISVPFLISSNRTLNEQRQDLIDNEARLTESLSRFDYLAAIEEFRSLLTEEEALSSSPDPTQITDLENWIQRAERIVALSPSMKETRTLLEQKLQSAASENAGSENVLLRQITDHLSLVNSAVEPGGHLHYAKRRVAFASEFSAEAIEDDAMAWNAVRERLLDQNGPYKGLGMPPQRGLVPLGPDQQTGFEEFAAKIPGLNVPQRDLDTGRLQLVGDWAPVLVLIPADLRHVGSQSIDKNDWNYDPFAPRNSRMCFHIPPTWGARWMGKFETTVAQFNAMAQNPVPDDPHHKVPTTHRPVTNISWMEADRACRSWGLILPLEIDWEIAARGGTGTIRWTGDLPESLVGKVNGADEAFVRDRKTNEPHEACNDGYAGLAPVDSFASNRFGIWHPLGNASEMCLDQYVRDRTASTLVNVPEITLQGVPDVPRVWRGGSYESHFAELRSALRRYISIQQRTEYLGFRISRLTTE